MAMGFAAGEAILPLIAVMAIAAIGWRGSYIGVALVVLMLVLPTSMWLLRGHHGRHQDYELNLNQREAIGSESQQSMHDVGKSAVSIKSWRRRDVLRDYRFYLI